ncbi:GFA family protein [Pseudomonas sp. SZMC_28357]|uniref:GFA family protein n=1 Tax=Pseudomonas sp. SZMC_28357 TaxID=3074380 RepID=UPI0028716000|nr:GFA family protein [Pseudomonas sp. SZMC_28357]MDR9753773.1 GFA family protein [Pseudomonas sp. SZMC_28357]
MIKRIGETEIKPLHRASCHCGAVVLELELPDGVVEPKRCNCSLCRRRGAVMGTVPLAALRVVEGADVLKSYRFNTQQACHYFCSICGIYTHHIRRSDPSLCGYNLGCLEGVEPTDLGLLPVSNGRNHPLDNP